MGFSNYVLLDEIKKYIRIKKFNYIFYFTLIFFIFINIFFYRIQEHGTDRSAQILIGLLFIQIFKFIEFNKVFEIEKILISNILILLGLIVSLKSFYILYFILIFPIIWILYKEKKISIFYNLFKDKLFYYLLFLILLIFSVYLINTGCIIYPVSFTCFENFDWSIGAQQTKQMNQHYQLWSKAGKTPNFSVSDFDLYLKDFNWVSNWINLYFFNKVLDFILGLFLLIGIIFFTYKNNIKKKRDKISNNIVLIYFTIILLFVEWFLNHPALRYGGYILITLLMILPLSLILERYKNFYEIILKKTIIVVIITVVIFSFRNFIRIDKEKEKYEYDPINKVFFRVEKNFFRIDKKLAKLINNYNDCLKDINSCDLNLFKKIKKNKNKYIFIND